MRIDEYEVDVEKLIARWGIEPVSTTGPEINAACPWKRHKTGNNKFYINTTTGLWTCQACPDKKGNIRQLILQLEDIERDELHDFIRSNGREITLDDFDEHILDILYEDDEYDEILTSKQIKSMRQQTRSNMKHSFRNKSPAGYWRRHRGFTLETIGFWNLRVQPEHKTHPYIIPVSVDGIPYFHIRRSRTEEQLRQNGLEVTRKYLFQYKFPRREILFGLDKAESAQLVLCEGPLDAIKVWQALHERDLLDKYSPVAIFGSAVTGAQHKLLDSYADSIILFFDDDTGGHKCAEKFLEESTCKNIAVVQYTDKITGDPGDLTSREILKLLPDAVDSLVLMIREEFDDGEEE